MDIVCHGPFRARTLLWQPGPGAWALTIACHAVHDLAQRASPLSARPLASPEGDGDDRNIVEPWGPVAPRKRWCEVVVVGHAHAPPGDPVASLLARVAVGEVDKVVRVCGDSHFTQAGALVGPAMFTRMPLRWERAAGGPRTGNPRGVRMGAEALVDTQGRVALPNLRPAGPLLEARDQVLDPVGFGPLAPTAPARAARLGARAAQGMPAHWTEWPMPVGFDFGYFDVAPPDQALKEINGMERIALEHLHPTVPRLVTYLAATPPRAMASLGGAEQALSFTCDTLVIDADQGQAVLVWRAVLSLDHPRREGVVVIAASAGADDVTSTLAASAEPARAALPFQPPSATSAPSPPLPTIAEARRPSRSLRATTLVLSQPAPTETLPFVPARARDVHEDEPVTQRRPHELGSTPPPAPIAIAPPAPIAIAPPEPIRIPSPEPIRIPSPPEPIRIPSPPEPIRMASPEPIRIPSPEPPRSAPPPPSEPTRPSRAPASAPSAPEPPPPAEIPLERCAGIDARLAARPTERRALLEVEGLDEERWSEQLGRRLAEIDEELDRGKKGLLSSYDNAYVAALEALRGPITAEEYARVSVAAERGRAKRELTRLDLPEASLMRLRRVWLDKTVRDPRAAAELRAELRAARGE